MQPTVFIVSSNTSSQQQMARILQDSYYQVQVAARGADVG
jgi:DNA-binding response OmpR family regulator